MLLTQAATPEPSAQTRHRSLGPASGCCVLYDEEKTAPSSLQASVRVDVGSEQWAQQQIQLLTVLSLQRVGTVHHQTQWHDVIFTVPGTGGAAPTMNKLCAIVPFLLFNRAPQNAGALCAQQRDKLMRFVPRIFWRYCHPLQTQMERRRRQLPLSGLNRSSVRAKSALLTLSSGSSSLQANQSQKTRLAISWAIWKSSSKPLQRSVGWMQIQRRLNTLVQV